MNWPACAHEMPLTLPAHPAAVMPVPFSGAIQAWRASGVVDVSPPPHPAAAVIRAEKTRHDVMVLVIFPSATVARTGLLLSMQSRTVSRAPASRFETATDTPSTN